MHIANPTRMSFLVFYSIMQMSMCDINNECVAKPGCPSNSDECDDCKEKNKGKEIR